MSEPIPDATHMGAVHLTVADLPVSLEFYRESIENVLAFLEGKPVRVLNQEALGKG